MSAPIPKEPGTLDRLPTFITVDELATLVRVDRKTAYDAVARGQIPGARRIGRSIRISRDAVVKWLREQGRGSLSGEGR